MIGTKFYVANDGYIRIRHEGKLGNKAFVGVCEKCGNLFISQAPKVNCSRSCAQKGIKKPYLAERNRQENMRQLTAERNKNLDFRKKVSDGLKKRKQELGENYHSKETKAKIGKATRERWEEVKDLILPILLKNAAQLKIREYYPYDFKWRKLSDRLGKIHGCARCGTKMDLVVHHIIPAKNGGEGVEENVAVLCNSCHPIVEKQQREIYKILGDWEVTALLVKCALRGEAVWN